MTEIPKKSNETIEPAPGPTPAPKETLNKSKLETIAHINKTFAGNELKNFREGLIKKVNYVKNPIELNNINYKLKVLDRIDVNKKSNIADIDEAEAQKEAAGALLEIAELISLPLGATSALSKIALSKVPLIGKIGAPAFAAVGCSAANNPASFNITSQTNSPEILQLVSVDGQITIDGVPAKVSGRVLLQNTIDSSHNRLLTYDNNGKIVGSESTQVWPGTYDVIYYLYNNKTKKEDTFKGTKTLDSTHNRIDFNIKTK